nr:IGF-like family receptor 1 [Misgurnus anguillicaudatus]
MTSDICVDGQYFDRDEHKCEPCKDKFNFRKGFEFTSNCGLDDHSNVVDSIYQICRKGTFNDGSFEKCQKCTQCLYATLSPCNSESNAVCCQEREFVKDGHCVVRPVTTTVIPTTSRNLSTPVSFTEPSTTQAPTHPRVINETALFVCVGFLSVLTLLCMLFILRRRTRRSNREQNSNGEIREILPNESLPQKVVFENKNADWSPSVFSSKLLAPEIQNASLNTVLNNLDVLEELVLLLDPDISGAKNTRHLAAQCSFSFAWINYAYLMKDHKSPLVAVLEGVVAKNPDWTVADFARLLTAIGRNDAVEILTKLHVNV